MTSQYLKVGELVAYGLPATTTDIQIQQASRLIDAYINRNEGLVYATDYTGVQPAYMLGMEPELTFNSSGAISTGSKVAVPLTQNIVIMDDMLGQTAVLDRADPTKTETVVVSNIAQGQLTFDSVAVAHNANCTIEIGMAITEERQLPAKRSIARTMQPIVRVLSVMGRYGYGRRTDQTAGMYNEVNLLAAIQTFGGPPLWEPVDPTKVGITATNRELWIPAGILLAYFSEVRLRYLSGWKYESLPGAIKQACANIVNNIQQNPGVPPTIKTFQSGQNKMERFSDSLLDRDTKAMLDTYRIAAFA